MAGRHRHEEPGIKVPGDEDEAIMAANGLERMAYQRLDACKARGWKDPSGYGEAIGTLPASACAAHAAE